MKRAAVCGALACIAVVACSQGFNDDILSDASGCCIERPDSTTADSSNDVATIDAGPKYNGGGPFTCLGCICDGTQDMCFVGGGGGAPIVDASDDADLDAAPTCNADDSGPSSCIAIPLSCLPKPDCACINQVEALTGCTCSVTADGNGFLLTCPPRP